MANKKRKCIGCKQYKEVEKGIIVGNNRFACSIDCAVDAANKGKRKGLDKLKKHERSENRKAKQKLKTKGEWTKEAQIQCNKFIRVRDRDEPCISCGRTNEEVEQTDGWKPGGAWDCGHFLSVGSHPELRFHQMNANKQCKSCNGGSGKHTKKNYTVSIEYERRLREKIGDEMVDWLKGPIAKIPQKLTIEDLIEVKGWYRQQIKAIE